MDKPLTVPEVIDALGGTAAVAKLFNLKASAVSNWKIEGFPASRHLEIYELCQERGIDYHPRRAA